MQKQELIHIHGLLTLVRTYLDERDETPAGAFGAYDTYDVSPTAIHERKDTHEVALWYLLAGVDTSLMPEETPPDNSPTHSE